MTCKNYEFHREKNPFHGHRIPLGKMDEQMTRPDIPERLVVRCSDCSKEFQYDRSEVLRFQLQLPERFTPHPLFLIQRWRVLNAWYDPAVSEAHTL